MDMLLMLGIMAAVFFIAIIVMCCFRDKLESRLIHILFIVGTGICFFAWNYAMYDRGGLRDGFMTLENISPYICTVILFSPFLGEKVREFVHSAIAFLAVGMFVALFISPGADYLSSPGVTANFMHVSEAACHLLMALYGFYLIISSKVKVNMKSLFKSLVFIYLSIGFGVFINFYFHRDNFGMDMYGDYSIYFLDIFESFEATFVAYLIGVLGTILIGYLAAHFMDWISRPAEVGEKSEKIESVENIASTENTEQN